MRDRPRGRNDDVAPTRQGPGSVDWPYESNKLGAEFLQSLPLSAQDKAKIAHGNAERVLRM